MKVILKYRNYRDMDRIEIFPNIYKIEENDKPEDALRKIWQDCYDSAVAENIEIDNADPVNNESCWCKEDMAVVTWEDGDTAEFYVVDLEEPYQTFSERKEKNA